MKYIGIIPTIIVRRNSIYYIVDHNLIKFIKKCFPKHHLEILIDRKEIKKISLIISTGGNSIVSINKGRANKIRKLMDDYYFTYAYKNNISYLGICHGAQHVAKCFKSQIIKKRNHTKKNHSIFFKSMPGSVKVNSYHDYSIKKLPKKLNTLAYTKDGSIEAFKHKNKKILGIMWHPERYKKIKKFDLNFLKKHL